MDNLVWKSIWKLIVPPKLFHFSWWCLHNGLAVKQSLVDIRCVVDDMSCPLCKDHVETMLHFLIGCHKVSSILTALCLSFSFHRYVYGSFQDLFMGLSFWSQFAWDSGGFGLIIKFSFSTAYV